MFSISRVEFNGATGFMIDDIRFLLALEYEQKCILWNLVSCVCLYAIHLLRMKETDLYCRARYRHVSVRPKK